jgi:hypothetical protein
MPEIVGTVEIVPATADMTATEGMPERAGTLAKHQQQHVFQKQVGILAVVPATAGMTAIVGVPERAWTPATEGTPATVTAAGTTARVGKENFLFLNILFLSVHDT